MAEKKEDPNGNTEAAEFFLAKLRTHMSTSRGVIHVGAHQGEEVEAYLSYGFKKIILIEANPKWCEFLSEKYKNENILIFNYAVTDLTGSVTLQIHESRLGSTEPASILDLKKFKEYYKYIKTPASVEVPAIRLDDLFEKHQLNPMDYDFLNMDIQGAELKALKGAPKLLGHLKAVLSEVHLEELYEGCASEKDIVDFLEGAGFRKVESQYRELYNEKGSFPVWGDVLFIKK
ncbi:MAG TPA: FkbM family methyltransferase [bacterium]|jgi:FkbM family methyltransferase|nr:FkbM family methyltransferase [bacterium]